MQSKESSLSNVWTQRNLGITTLPQNLGSATSSEVKQMCDTIYPFIQVINSEAIFAEETQVQFITAATGWAIHDYGDAISISAPHSLNPANPKATMVKQQIDTIAEAAKLITAKGWPATELIAGTKMMQRLMWIETKRYGFEFKGYEPTADDQKCCEQLMKHIKDHGLTWEKPKSKRLENIRVTGAS